MAVNEAKLNDLMGKIVCDMGATLSAALVVTPAVLVGRLRDSLELAEKKLFLHAWHLKALAPTEEASAR